jgi:Cellulase (glycosyl hydrolase family 5)
VAAVVVAVLSAACGSRVPHPLVLPGSPGPAAGPGGERVVIRKKVVRTVVLPRQGPSANGGAGVAGGPRSLGSTGSGLNGSGSAGSGSGGSPAAPAIDGWLHTDGPRIEDASGTTVRLLGLGVPGMDSSNDQGSPERDACGRWWRTPPAGVYANTAAWGFNSVRLALAWANLEPQPPTPGPAGTVVHHWNWAYLAALDAVVRGFGERGIAVVLDMHQYGWSSAFKGVPSARGVRCEGYGMPAWLYPGAGNGAGDVNRARCDFMADRAEPGVPEPVWGGFAAAWGFLAGRYAGDPTVVAGDLLNEPYYQVRSCREADMEGLYERVAAVVRAVNPHLLLILEDTAYRADGRFGLGSFPPIPNAVYSFHLYRPTWEAGRTVVGAFLSRAFEWNVPVYLGEFNAFNAARDEGGPSWAADTLALLDTASAAGMSWAFWAYCGRNSLIVRGPTESPKASLLAVLQRGL